MHSDSCPLRDGEGQVVILRGGAKGRGKGARGGREGADRVPAQTGTAEKQGRENSERG